MRKRYTDYRVPLTSRRRLTPKQVVAAIARLAQLRAAPWGKRKSWSKEYHNLSAVVWHHKNPTYARDYAKKYREL